MTTVGIGAVLIDTDVFSYAHRRDSRAERFRPVIDGQLILLSFITVGELLRGAIARGWGESKRQRLQEEIGKATVLPFDEALVTEYAKLTAHAGSTGHPLGQPEHSNDAWIAATARLHGVPLVTGNQRHFTDTPDLILLP